MFFNNFFFKKKNLFLFMALLLSFSSFYLTIYQSIYTFDTLHWGFINQSAMDYVANKTPYKDIFIQYGPLSVLINSYILKLSGNIFLSIMVLTSFFYATSLLLIFLISKKLIDDYNAFLILLCLFLIHPLAVYPWYLYLGFFLICLGIFLILINSKLSTFISGILFGLLCLNHENYFYILFSIFLINLIINFRIILSKQKIFKLSLIFHVGFLIPLILFYTYLNYYDLVNLWSNNLKLNKTYLDSRNISLLSLSIDAFLFLLKTSMTNFFEKPYYFIFVLIILSNLVFLIFFFLKKKNNLIIFNLTLLSCGLYFNTIHAPTNIFRYSTGFVLGLITLFFLINSLKSIYLKKLLKLTIICLSILSIQFYKSDTNPFYPSFQNYKLNKKTKEYNYFKYTKWSPKIYDHYENLFDISKKISSNCKIQYFVNFTQDGFAFSVLSKNLESYQYISLYKFDYQILESIYKFYNVNLILETKKKIMDEDVIIYINKNNLNIFNDEDKYEKIFLPYNYWLKNKVLLKPKSCSI